MKNEEVENCPMYVCTHCQAPCVITEELYDYEALICPTCENTFTNPYFIKKVDSETGAQSVDNEIGFMKSSHIVIISIVVIAVFIGVVYWLLCVDPSANDSKTETYYIAVSTFGFRSKYYFDNPAAYKARVDIATALFSQRKDSVTFEMLQIVLHEIVSLEAGTEVNVHTFGSNYFVIKPKGSDLNPMLWVSKDVVKKKTY